jgi:chorismate-pyruvate lyase
LEHAVLPLELEAGEPVMRREILLSGGRSGNRYVYAESLIVVNRLDPALRADLLDTNNPLGRVWVKHNLETRKEILKIWRSEDPMPANHLGVSEVLARSYRVFSAAQPIMLITEFIPADLPSAA